MPIEYLGISPASRVSAMDKLRLTWNVDTAILGDDLQLFGLFGTDTYKQATKLRDALPSAGCIAVSPITATPGDLAIVLDVRLASMWGIGTHTAADVAARVAGLSVAYVNLARMRKIDPNLSSVQTDSQIQQEIVESNKLAQATPSFLESFTSKIGTGVLVIVAVAVGVYVLARSK